MQITHKDTKPGLSASLLVLVTLILPSYVRAASPQTWTATNAPARLSTAWLLTDGRIMAQQYCSNHWWALAPDSSGNYANSSWTPLADTPAAFSSLYYASAVLPDGWLVVMGGEYSSPNCTGGLSRLSYIYDPAHDAWTQISPPPGWSVSDANSIVLATEQFVVADVYSAEMFALDPVALTWTQLPATGKLDGNDEEGWTLLPDGRFLTVDASLRRSSEIYDPIAGRCTGSGDTAVNLSDALSSEVGPAILMYNGNVFATGGGLCFAAIGSNCAMDENGHTATYNLSSGLWSAGPDFPSPLDISDGPAALLPNGKVLLVTSPQAYKAGAHFFEYDGATLNTVRGTLNASFNAAFYYRFLLLPNGQVMATDGSADVEFYNPEPGVIGTAAPQIVSLPGYVKPGNSYTLLGMQLNGLSQAVAYGDDAQQATNYPVLQISNDASSHITFARTHDHSSMGVAAGGAISGTNFDVQPALRPDLLI